MKRIQSVVVCLIAMLVGAGCSGEPQIVYAQTSLEGSTGSSPGLYDQLGLLAGPESTRRDFYEIITNNTGQDVRIQGAVLYGSVAVASTAVLVPVRLDTVNGLEGVVVPDTDPGHALAIVPVLPGAATPGEIEISFSPAVDLAEGESLAFGFIVPLETVVDATLLGTDTLPVGLSSTTPAYYTGFYATDAFGAPGFAFGNHYLVVLAEPESNNLFLGAGMLLLAAMLVMGVLVIRARKR